MIAARTNAMIMPRSPAIACPARTSRAVRTPRRRPVFSRFDIERSVANRPEVVKLASNVLTEADPVDILGRLTRKILQ